MICSGAQPDTSAYVYVYVYVYVYIHIHMELSPSFLRDLLKWSLELFANIRIVLAQIPIVDARMSIFVIQCMEEIQQLVIIPWFFSVSYLSIPTVIVTNWCRISSIYVDYSWLYIYNYIYIHNTQLYTALNPHYSPLISHFRANSLFASLLSRRLRTSTALFVATSSDEEARCGACPTWAVWKWAASTHETL